MSKVTYRTDDKTEWDQRTSNIEPLKMADIPYQDLFNRLLPHNPKFKCIEIGAIPGSFLVYFYKQFGYHVTGLDFADNDKVFHDTMAANGIKDYDFIHSDFLAYHSDDKYDVVTSFGFVEHFDDYPDVVRRHCQLVKPGGYLVITMPNFRYLQFVYHLLFDRANLDIHNTKVMQPKKLGQIIAAEGFEPLFNGYYGKLQLWRDTALSGLTARVERFIRHGLISIGRYLPVSRFYSPSIVLIYHRSSK